MPKPFELTAQQAVNLIKSGALTSQNLLASCLERIAEREPVVAAWEYLDPDYAMAQARLADRSSPRGLLHGVPIGVKDIIDTYDMPCALGSALYEGRRPQWDAACVAACRKAGAVLLGKTVTTEFAYFQAGKTRNPHQADRTPGGSSSGSAAAVADTMVPIAFGTQTAGSVIRPAAFCGIYAYKASHGEFSMIGIHPLAQSLDSLGVFARSVEDLRLLRRVLLGEDESTAITAAPQIGFCRTPYWDQVEHAAQKLIDDAVNVLRSSGIPIEEVELPEAFTQLTEAQKVVMAYEAAHNFIYELEHHRNRLSTALCNLLDSGYSRNDYRAAKQTITHCATLLTPLFIRYHALLTPSAKGEAPVLAAGTGDPLFNRAWTALGLPSVALPIGNGDPLLGLPIGVQLIGAHGDDARLLEIAERMKFITRP